MNINVKQVIVSLVNHHLNKYILIKITIVFEYI